MLYQLDQRFKIQMMKRLNSFELIRPPPPPGTRRPALPLTERAPARAPPRPLRRPRHCRKQQLIRQIRRRSCPRRVGEALGLELAQAPLRRPRQRRKQQRLQPTHFRERPRCAGEVILVVSEPVTRAPLYSLCQHNEQQRI